MIGIDTSALIDLGKGNESIKQIIENLEEPIAFNRLSYLELMFGINPENKAHKKEEDFYDTLFEESLCLELNKESSKKATQILHELKKKGRPIELFDCIIAAIYLTNGVTSIITTNKKHFENISGLKVISYI